MNEDISSNLSSETLLFLSNYRDLRSAFFELLWTPLHLFLTGSFT